MSSLYESYDKARKMALACVRERTASHLDPYLPVLDELLRTIPHQAGAPSRSEEILTSRIAGTCHAGRTESFAWNFMPLLEDNSEFAHKWMNLYHSALEEGLRDPISVYEVFGHYYVEEGNKRVSVTRFMGNPKIEAVVRPLTLSLPEGKAKDLYDAYLHFVGRTGIRCILMNQKKNYRQLERLLFHDDRQTLDKQDRENLLSLYYSFESVFEKLKGNRNLKAASGDAFLIFLEVYGPRLNRPVPQPVLEKELEQIWPEIEAWPSQSGSRLLDEADLPERRSLFSLFHAPLQVVFIESLESGHSAWTREHEEGVRDLISKMGRSIMVQIFDQCDTEEKTREALRKAVEMQADVVFTTNPTMLQITSRFAARYPSIHFLNCSLNPSTGPLRTYFAREYEVEFLMGIAAGVLNESGHIGYIADYPIYGTIAAINAFAVGVQMVQPYAKIFLDWSTTQRATLTDFPMDVDMLYLAGQDFDPRVQKGKKFGLFDVRTGKFMHLANVEVHWGVFYERIVRSVLSGTYGRDEQETGTSSINYWLGFSSGLLDVTFNDELPEQSRRLIAALEDGLTDKKLYPFAGSFKTNTGKDEQFEKGTDYQKISTMNWLNENIVGSIPDPDQLVEDAADIVRVHGLDTLEDEDHEE